MLCTRWQPTRRWYTGGGQGGSGQEVIAPGAAGADKVKGFMDAIQPHARQGTADDLETKQGAFSGSARTLNGSDRTRPDVTLLHLRRALGQRCVHGHGAAFWVRGHPACDLSDNHRCKAPQVKSSKLRRSPKR